jgi:hypothetical protein
VFEAKSGNNKVSEEKAISFNSEFYGIKEEGIAFSYRFDKEIQTKISIKN